MSAPRVNATYSLDTPRATGAIASVTVRGDIDGALRALGAAPVRAGDAKLRSIAGVDRGVVVRWSDDSASITPHGGAAVVRAVLEALRLAGLSETDPADAIALHPEASDRVEALALEAVARAASPRAVELLLDQSRRWREWDRDAHPLAQIAARSATLSRLLDPPTVVALGASNIGKSTLLNALAQRAAALAHDEPGVTRDHVGVAIELDGLCVRWFDTPGIRDTEDQSERDAIDLALRVAADADLIVLCADAGAPWPEPPPGRPSIRAGLRADLGGVSGAEALVSATRGEGLEALARLVRRALVSDEALSWQGPWLFDPRVVHWLGGSEARSPST